MSDPVVPPLGRLLIVDDELSLVTALISTLRDEGYAVKGASRSADALTLLQQERFDVLLTDLQLPESDGISLLQAALAIDPTLSGILMTGHGSIDTAVDAMKAGAIDYVLKPFKLKTVLAVLGRALAVRRLRLENDALQRRLEGRTKELEAANRELEVFSYSVSHDLRAPLRAIESFTEILVEETEKGITENARSYGERIRRGVTRMGTMIDELLQMAKAVRTEVNRVEVNVGELAREILAQLQSEAPQRKVENIVADGMVAFGDPGLLRIVLENLLGNAWKYAGRQEVTQIEVGWRAAEEENVFYVRDNGVGFDMAEAGQLFVPFHRLVSAKDFEGNGVGLATVQRIVQRHGGRIWAQSEPAQGAMFSFSLPHRLPAESPGPRPPPAKAAD